jgi:sugar O-acyltransferase (sialic acid O-acetyltransferase NeuD family)
VEELNMKKLIVFGNGQPAECNYFFHTHDSDYQVAAFTVDQEFIKEDTLFGLPVVAFEDIERTYSPHEYKMSILISYRNMNRLKAEKYYQAKKKGYELVNYISSRATTWPGLVIGDNCFISENCNIGAFAKIGNNIFVGPGSSIGHHCTIKDHCFIGPHAVILGSTTVEPYCVIGANSTIRDGGITIGRECIIGSGVLISADTRERGVYVNAPAKRVGRPSNELASLLTFGVKPYKHRHGSS